MINFEATRKISRITVLTGSKPFVVQVNAKSSIATNPIVHIGPRMVKADKYPFMKVVQEGWTATHADGTMQHIIGCPVIVTEVES